jgi:hypothetical protein
MAARFIRIPYGSRLKFPATCPFTGQSNPRGKVNITLSNTQLWLPIPFIGSFRLRKVGRMAFSANSALAWAAKIVALLRLVSSPVGVVAFICLAKKGDAEKGSDGISYYFLIGGVVAALVFRIVHWLLLSRVRIVRIGAGGLEVRFASEKYASEFAGLNDFHASDHRSKKRATPITVNAVR